jgi:phosphoenolpyruvate carboxykinase (diphosphate)
VPVTAVLPGRRNNPPDPAARPPLRPLCVFGPLHYMEPPELFMEFIASITGRSPSTTGAGSEGALTKGPFNALLPVHDLNNALVSQLLTNQPAFVSSAGHVGPKYRVDHDVSLLVPELFARMQPAEQDPAFLIREGMLERCEDFELAGRTVRASRLGWRITARFVRLFGGRVFTNPGSVFPEDMLRPELQDPAVFADGIDNLCEAHQWVAQRYFDDGSIELACPPLRVLLTIMARGDWDGRGPGDPAVRAMFRPESLLESDWYRDRLRSRQRYETALWERHIRYLEEFLAKPNYHEVARSMNCQARLDKARRIRDRVAAPERLAELVGTLGREAFE